MNELKATKERTPEVLVEIEALDKEVCLLCEIIDSLHARVSSIASPEQPPEICEPKELKEICPIAHDIRNKRFIVAASFERIQSILERLQI